MAEIKEFKNKKSKRSFEAAQMNRLTSSWNTFIRSINEDLRYELPVLRARSRELAQNEPLMKKFLSMCEENVAGSQGFQLQAKSYDDKGVDTEANSTIERHWAKWSDKKCDIRQKLNLSELTRLVVRTIAKDGEVLVRHIFSDRNAYGYSIQIIDPSRIAEINEDTRSGNKILSGIEIDEYGTPQAFHLYVDKCQPGAKTVRIPANEISHIFIEENPGQIRGIPWAHAAMVRMNIAKKYVEHALVASAIAASSMGFFIQNQGDIDNLADEEGEDGELYTSAQGGTFSVLPKGFDFKEWNPNNPSQIFPDFTKAINRSIATALEVNYNILCEDLEGVSYSSIRSSVIAERARWMKIQDSIISQFMDVIFMKWLDSSLLRKSLTSLSGNPLPVNKKEKFSTHTFLGRRWLHIDPIKDMSAKIMALDNKLESPYSIAQEQGRDLDNILSDIQRFEAECEKRGIKSQSVLQQMQINPYQPDVDEEE